MHQHTDHVRAFFFGLPKIGIRGVASVIPKKPLRCSRLPNRSSRTMPLTNPPMWPHWSSLLPGDNPIMRFSNTPCKVRCPQHASQSRVAGLPTST